MSRVATGSESVAFRAAATGTAAITLAVGYSTVLWHGLSSHGDTCIFHRLTGWKCPLCGMSHAVVALLHGNVVVAMQRNPLAPLYLLGLALTVAVAWVPSVRVWARRESARLPSCTAAVFAVSVLCFGVARNL